MDEILHQLIVTWLSFFWIHLYILCSTEYSIIDTVDGWNPAPVDCHMTLFFLNTSIYVVFNMYIHNWHFLMVQKSCTSWYYIVGSWNPIIYRGFTHPWWLALGISSINRSMLWGLGSSWERAAEGCCPQQPSAVGESQRVKKQLFTETQSYMNQFFGLYVLCCINLCVCIDYR